MKLPNQSELGYLEELIRDFPARADIDPEEAVNLIQSRYLTLESQCSAFVVSLKDVSRHISFDSLFLDIIPTSHSFLFKDILSNAGRYRKSSEPNNGYVGFGGTDTRSATRAKFHGSPPITIKKEIETAAKMLSSGDAEPVKNSILFYQRFVHIHPFYDANGRIGRLILTIYLGYYGYAVLWKDLETTKKNTFLKKLNACHKREGQEIQREYLEILYQFWKEFVIPQSELEL